jgi:alpha-tubulin suppressor-like RCC1 family protein
MTPGPRAVQVALGGAHGCAVLDDATLRCWGTNDSGQLGDGTTSQHLLPAPVPWLSAVAQVSLGDDHACAVGADGSLHCWGDNGAGAVGDGTDTTRLVPTPVPSLSGVVEVGAGYHVTWARTGDDAVWAWGLGGHHQLCDYDDAKNPVPAPIGIHATSLAAGGLYLDCALDAWHAVRCCGTLDKDSAVWGDPIAVSPLAPASSATVGVAHACATLSDGTAACWGENTVGELGNATAGPTETPAAVTGLDDVWAIAAGSQHTCALQHGGEVWCWGRNVEGQLGNGSFAAPGTWGSPAQVPGLIGAVQIVARGSATCVLRVDGRVLCWGDNSLGQIGDGTKTNRAQPTLVEL